jgi:hypothetical protein
MLFETIALLTRLMATVREIPECILVGIRLYIRHLEYAPKIATHPQRGNADNMHEFYNLTGDRIIWVHSDRAPGDLVCKFQLNESNNHFTNAIETYMEGLIMYFYTMNKTENGT